VYEDLYFAEITRQHQQIEAIWDLLGIAPLAPERYEYYLRPECVKMNSEATYAFLPNAREIHEACGDDLTGWLFE
jgi:hypothetical protein